MIDGGELGEHKGINAPHVPLRSDITEKDQRDLKFGLALGVDLVALSFVQSADDITRVRSIMVAEGRAKVPIVAKLERPEAIEQLDEILDAADAVMVARGDLGLEIPLERVPRVQKEILRKARARGVPVIVATQVLESMRTEPRPTRAEASDAAGAVDGGADAIMLSGETATGLVSGAIGRSARRDHPRRRVDDARRRASSGAGGGGRSRQGAVRGGGVAVAALQRPRDRRDHARRADGEAAVGDPPAGGDRRGDGQARSGALPALWHGVLPIVCELEGETEQVIARVVESAVKRARRAPESATMVVVNTSADLDRGSSNFVQDPAAPYEFSVAALTRESAADLAIDVVLHLLQRAFPAAAHDVEVTLPARTLRPRRSASPSPSSIAPLPCGRHCTSSAIGPIGSPSGGCQ